MINYLILNVFIVFIYNPGIASMNFKSYLTKINNLILIQRFKRTRKANIYLLTAIGYLSVAGIFLFGTEKGRKKVGSSISSTTKQLSQLTIPVRMRNYVYRMYANRYGVNVQEADKQLNEYKNFSQFFTRNIKPRPQFKQNLQNPKIICSPCDAQILNISKITSNQNIIIKDITYKLSNLIFDVSKPQYSNTFKELQFSKQNELYQVILYLCPGDYHRFHAPYGIDVKSFREFKGLLKPVNVSSIIKNGGVVYEQNARKVLHCSYLDKNNNRCYLGLAMIGALNVGDIVVNQKSSYQKGEEIGYFNLGSTIVMIMESNPNTKWNKKIGEKVKFGQKLCQFE